MSKNLDYMSEYLAGELSNTKLYNIADVKAKIKAGLLILIDKEVKTATTEKLRKKTNNHIKLTEKHEIEIKYWKDLTRSFVQDKDKINGYYNEIDSLLKSKGLK